METVMPRRLKSETLKFPIKQDDTGRISTVKRQRSERFERQLFVRANDEGFTFWRSTNVPTMFRMHLHSDQTPYFEFKVTEK